MLVKLLPIRSDSDVYREVMWQDELRGRQRQSFTPRHLGDLELGDRDKIRGHGGDLRRAALGIVSRRRVRILIAPLMLILLTSNLSSNGIAATAYDVTLGSLQKDWTIASRYTITNPSTINVDIIQSFYANDGTFVGTSTNQVIPAQSSTTIDLQTYDNGVVLPEGFDGYVIISADNPITAALLPPHVALPGEVCFLPSAFHTVAAASVLSQTLH